MYTLKVVCYALKYECDNFYVWDYETGGKLIIYNFLQLFFVPYDAYKYKLTKLCLIKRPNLLKMSHWYQVFHWPFDNPDSTRKMIYCISDFGDAVCWDMLSTRKRGNSLVACIAISLWEKHAISPLRMLLPAIVAKCCKRRSHCKLTKKGNLVTNRNRFQKTW